MIKKIRMLKVNFKSYLKFIFIGACCICVVGAVVILFLGVNGAVKITFHGPPPLELLIQAFHGPDSWIFKTIILLLLLLIEAMLFALLAFPIFNWVLKIGKGTKIRGEFGRESNEQVLVIQELSFLSYLKLYGTIALMTGIIYALIVAVCSIFQYDPALFGPHLLALEIKDPWWNKTIEIITLPIQFWIDSLVISVLLFLFYNWLLSKTKGIAINGEFQRMDE